MGTPTMALHPKVTGGQGGLLSGVAGGVWSDQSNSNVDVIVYNHNADHLNLDLC